jgi:hypothetical protein
VGQKISTRCPCGGRGLAGNRRAKSIGYPRVYLDGILRKSVGHAFSMQSGPVDLDENFEQLRAPIIRGEGVTNSERHLARLAEKSFLNLWSYPSLFRDQKQSGVGDGKELCDLLVVFDKTILIFSEKTIAWPQGDVRLAWSRWVKRAIRASTDQAKGAERWLAQHPKRIFLDRECTKPFPIDFPSLENREIHRVIIANGAAEESRRHYPGSSGSFVIQPSIQGDQHWNGEGAPFAIGDVDPQGSFVHVFDEVALDVVMRELDTIIDFTDYLDKRAIFIRSGKLREAHGEENLLGFYAVRINEQGDHDFFSAQEFPSNVKIGRDLYSGLTSDLRYIAKVEENKISYLWDELINGFTKHMLGGTSITPDGSAFDLNQSEAGVRFMAAQNRFQRRCHAIAVADALKTGKQKEIFFRLMVGEPGTKGAETAFFILTMKYQKWMEDHGGYQQYRLKRSERAQFYARGILERFPYLERVIGIAREPPDQGAGVSEDLLYAKQFDWSDDDREAIKVDSKALGILQDGVVQRAWGSDEFPTVNSFQFEPVNNLEFERPLNRKDRRAQAARSKRKRD